MPRGGLAGKKGLAKATVICYNRNVPKTGERVTVPVVPPAGKRVRFAGDGCNAAGENTWRHDGAGKVCGWGEFSDTDRLFPIFLLTYGVIIDRI